MNIVLGFACRRSAHWRPVLLALLLFAPSWGAARDHPGPGPATEPSVTIEVPVSNQTVGSDVSTLDFSGIASTDFSTRTLDRVEYRFSLGITGGTFMPVTETSYDAPTQTVTWSFTAEPLTFGENIIAVRAVDSPIGGGPERIGPQKNRIITRIRPLNQCPTVTIVVPATDTSVPEGTTTFDFSGTASDSDGVGTIDRVEYRVNGGAYTPAAGRADWTFTATGLVPGPNRIDVRAVDDLGCVSDPQSRTINVGVPPMDDPPTVTIDVPTTNTTVPSSQSTFDFSGTAFDLEGRLARVEFRINGGGFQLATGTATWNFTASGLVNGDNLVEVRSVDAPLNQLSPIAQRTITRGVLPCVQFEFTSSIVLEDAGQTSVDVLLIPASTEVVSVDYRIMGGTATPDVDYVLLAGTLTFPPGITRRTIPVIILDDLIPEGVETLCIELTAPVNAVLCPPEVHCIQIDDDDPVPMTDFRLDTWQLKMNRKDATKGGIKLKAEADTNPNAIDLAANGLTFQYDNGTTTAIDSFAGALFQPPSRGSKWKIKDPARQHKGSVLLNIGGSSRSKVSVSSKGNFNAVGGIVPPPPLEIELRSGAFQGGARITPTANKKGTSLSFNAKRMPGGFADPELYVDAMLARRVNNKTNKDSVRLTARIPGAPALDPAADDFTVNLGFFSITVPAGGWTIKKANLSFKTPKGSPLGKITVKYNMIKRTISVSAKNQALGAALTTNASVTVSYGTFIRTNAITLQRKANKSGAKETFRY